MAESVSFPGARTRKGPTQKILGIIQLDRCTSQSDRIIFLGIIMTFNTRSSHWNAKVWSSNSFFSGIGGSGRIFTFKNLRSGELFHYLGLGYGFGIGGSLELVSLGRQIARYFGVGGGAAPWANDWSTMTCYHPISASDMDLGSVLTAGASGTASASIAGVTNSATTYTIAARYSSDPNVLPTQTNLARFTDGEFMQTEVTTDLRRARRGPGVSLEMAAQHITLLSIPV